MRNKKKIAIVSSIIAAVALVFSGIVIAIKQRDRREWMVFLKEDNED